jgi:ubiquinone/menaquinone biosynthesis C-methylase UbiE
MSTFALQETFPDAQVTGLDLSPYFLAVAKYRSGNRSQKLEARSQESQKEEGQGELLLTTNNQQPTTSPSWLHAAAESTGLPDASFDLVSACLLFHELPQSAAIAIIREARRLLRPGGHFAIMDMNPRSEMFAKLPPYVMTLLKSTEPYLDEYFSLDLEGAIAAAGFTQPTVTFNSPRHRSIVAQVQ